MNKDLVESYNLFRIGVIGKVLSSFQEPIPFDGESGKALPESIQHEILVKDPSLGSLS